MRPGWSTVTLEDVATIERRGVDPKAIAHDTIYLGLEHIEAGGRIVGRSTVGESAVASTKFRFGPEHVLFGKLRPYLGKIAAPDFAGVCSTDILPILPNSGLDRTYLMHFLRQPIMVDRAAARAAGANLPRLSPSELSRFELPLPPIEEQRRIAAVLDHAERLIQQRQKSQNSIRHLEQSMIASFVSTHATGVVPFGSIVTSLRNGLSPATDGKLVGRVLTLSAVTRGVFDRRAAKDAVFDKVADASQRVKADTLLICRGNGNQALVGAGQMPRIDEPDLIYPDTMICAVFDQASVAPAYARAVWQLSQTKAAVQATAKTTNGIHKINQAGLSSVLVPMMSMPNQKQLAYRLEQLDDTASLVELSKFHLEELAEALQTRAFSGRL